MSQGYTGYNLFSGEIISLPNANLSAFCDFVTVSPSPEIQLDWIYGINSQTNIETETNGGVVDSNAGRLRLQSGTNGSGVAGLTSARPMKYRQGQGTLARFTPAFGTPRASATQLFGAGNEQDGYFFGYNGLTFGILHRNNSVDTWIAQTSWNGDTCDGAGASAFNWTKTFGNVCQIVYPFLGYGNIRFYVLDSETGCWILCHTIKYANTSTQVQLSNPNLRFMAEIKNNGNTTSITAYCGSVGFFTYGDKSPIGSPQWCSNHVKTAVTTETNILSVKNCTTFNGIVNRSAIRLVSATFSSAGGAGSASFRLIKNTTLGGAPSYTTISGSSADGGVTITGGNALSSVDTAGTTVTGGTVIRNFRQSTNTSSGNFLYHFKDDPVFILPGDILTFSASGTVSSTMSIAVNWVEDI